MYYCVDNRVPLEGTIGPPLKVLQGSMMEFRSGFLSKGFLPRFFEGFLRAISGYVFRFRVPGVFWVQAYTLGPKPQNRVLLPSLLRHH